MKIPILLEEKKDCPNRIEGVEIIILGLYVWMINALTMCEVALNIAELDTGLCWNGYLIICVEQCHKNSLIVDCDTKRRHN